MASRKIVRTDRSCKRCGASPITGYSFCSEPCRRIHRRRDLGVRPIEEVKAERRAARIQRHTKVCEFCGATFVMHDPGQKARAGLAVAGRFCSRSCHHGQRSAESQAKAVKLRLIRVLTARAVCGVCGDVFIKRTQLSGRCSPKCDAEHVRRQSAASARAKDQRDRSPRPCAECGIDFAPEYGNKRRLYCSSACHRRADSRIGKRIRRARMRGVTAEPVNPTKVFERDGWRCQICGVTTPRKLRGTTEPRAPEMDHIVPLADGGEHSYRNTQCACRSCNHAKGSGSGGQMRLFG